MATSMAAYGSRLSAVYWPFGPQGLRLWGPGEIRTFLVRKRATAWLFGSQGLRLSGPTDLVTLVGLSGRCSSGGPTN